MASAARKSEPSAHMKKKKFPHFRLLMLDVLPQEQENKHSHAPISCYVTSAFASFVYTLSTFSSSIHADAGFFFDIMKITSIQAFSLISPKARTYFYKYDLSHIK